MLQSCKHAADTAWKEGGCCHPPDWFMKKFLVLALLSLAGPNVSSLHAGPRVAIRVSPAVAFAPAVLTVRATVEPSDDNRMLSIEVDSSTYRRTSEIPLEGKNSQRTSVMEVRDVPTGLYEVRAVLVGSSGPIAKTMQLVKVEPAAGSNR